MGPLRWAMYTHAAGRRWGASLLRLHSPFPTSRYGGIPGSSEKLATVKTPMANQSGRVWITHQVRFCSLDIPYLSAATRPAGRARLSGMDYSTLALLHPCSERHSPGCYRTVFQRSWYVRLGHLKSTAEIFNLQAHMMVSPAATGRAPRTTAINFLNEL